MLSRLKYILFCLITIPCIIFILSCDQKEKYTGKYVQQAENIHEEIYNFIELKENNLGVWKFLDDEVSFTWTVSQNEIRLHIKSGGVISGKLRGDVVEIALPGRSTMYFKKTK